MKKEKLSYEAAAEKMASVYPRGKPNNFFI
jgi:hypothetical protein